MWLYTFCWTLFLVSYVKTVDRSNFKTCEQSSFCERQRKYSSKSDVFELELKSPILYDNVLSFQLKNTILSREYFLNLTFLSTNSIRFYLNEKNPNRKRFEIPDGDVILPFKKLIPKCVVLKDRFECIANKENVVKLYSKPFKTEVYQHGVLTTVINADNLLNIESLDSDESPIKEDPTSTETPATVDLSEMFKTHKDSRRNGPESVGVDIEFPGSEYAYGIPEHADSFVLKNTKNTDPYRLYNLDVFAYELYNPMALYGSIPMLFLKGENISTGMYWNNPSETWIDIESSRKSEGGLFSSFFSSNGVKKFVKTHWMSETGVIDLFLLLGKSNMDISKSFTSLTGTTPLPPLFSLAYHQCRWNYNNQEDIMYLDTNFDKYNIPVDVLWLDIEHTDGKRYFTWDSKKFPDPGKMVDDLLLKDRKLVTVIDPHIKADGGFPLYVEAKEKGYFIKDASGGEYSGWCWPGSSGYPDFTDKNVRLWWSSKFLSYDPVRNNTMFSWNDMGEPSVFSGPEVTMHKDAIHLNNFEHRDVHNLYGMYVHAATFEGQLLRSKNTKRPFVLTRAFFAGSQRTAAVWTGDNEANWNHLQISVPMLLSLSIAGMTFCGADVGGFFNNPDKELLTRWYQAGSHQPFFRAHAHLDTARREPWLYPEATMNLIRQAIQERYALLPYWYTQFAMSEHSGAPVMAPLWYYFPNEPSLLEIDNTYMIGKSILVSPVTVTGATSHALTLPKNEVWYQYPHWKKYTGGQISVVVNISTVPVFYRAGMIIPKRERMRRSSGLMKHDPYTLYITISDICNESLGYIYEDDFESVLDKTRQFYRMKFTLRRDTGGGHLRFEVPSKTEDDFMPGMDKNIRGRDSIIERLVFIGLPEKPEIIRRSMNKEPIEELQFHYIPSSKDEASVLIVRQPRINLSTLWNIQLMTAIEERTDL